jgi:hypothetical protein
MTTSPRPIKLHASEIIRRAHATLARLEEANRRKKQTQLAAYRALQAVRQIYYSMSPADQVRWQARRRQIESELNQVAREGTP